jgi:putative NADH-flavin reductase
MRILILGASQGTGALAAKTAIGRGHDVTAFARNPDRLALDSPKLARLRGDFHDRSSVDSAVKGHDAVISTASATSLGAFKTNPRYFS